MAGHAGYGALARPRGNRPPQVIHVACWAHARRKLFEVFQATKSSIAEEALQCIAALYAIDAEISGWTAEQRLAERRVRTRPLLDDLSDWTLTQRRQLSGKSALGTDLQYAPNRWEALALSQRGRVSMTTSPSGWVDISAGTDQPDALSPRAHDHSARHSCRSWRR
ncbi:IS66 family transposase [Falsiroseomonas sp. HW251]|uniref:IS66 family transposase n=1 Tax=Falsiroseomonas sp. HW251 TaxID=3390998 RepID=UPI003D31D960